MDVRRIGIFMIGVIGYLAMMWGVWTLLIFLGLSGEYRWYDIVGGIVWLAVGAVIVMVSRMVARRWRA